MKVNLSLKSWAVLGIVVVGLLSFVTGIKLLVLIYSLIAMVLFLAALIRDLKTGVPIAKALFVWYLLNLGAVYVVFSVYHYPGENMLGYVFWGLFPVALLYFAFADQKTAVRLFFYMQVFLLVVCMFC